MKETRKTDINQRAASAIGDILESISDLIVQIPCTGQWYEPKVPEQLQDK